jgi:kumamolisin
MKTNTFSPLRAGRWFGKTIMAPASGAMLLLALNSPSLAAERQVLRGHVPEAIARLNLQPVGRLPATNRLQLAISLPLRHANELARFLRDLYDPACPQFRRYLTCQQFTERFGPTAEDYGALQDFFKTNGFQVTATHPNRVLLDVSGTVGDIERTLRISMRTYAHPNPSSTVNADFE